MLFVLITSRSRFRKIFAMREKIIDFHWSSIICKREFEAANPNKHKMRNICICARCFSQQSKPFTKNTRVLWTYGLLKCYSTKIVLFKKHSPECISSSILSSSSWRLKWRKKVTDKKSIIFYRLPYWKFMLSEMRNLSWVSPRMSWWGLCEDQLLIVRF